MATSWIRDLFVYTVGFKSSHTMPGKAIAIFLRNVMGFTFQSESAGANSWVSTERNSSGATASVTGSSWVLTDSSAPFVSTDAGKLICIKDTSHPDNSGVYQIRQFLSSTQIVVDWAGANDQYPAASSSIAWWIWEPYYQCPDTVNQYVRLKSPHSTGWALEIKSTAQEVSQYVLSFTIAVDGDWAGTRKIGPVKITAGSGGWVHWDAIAHSDGSTLIMWVHKIGSTGIGSGMMVLISMLDPVDEGHLDIELIAAMGIASYPTSNYPVWSRYTNGNYANGRVLVWNESLQLQETCYLADYTAGGYEACYTWPWSGARENNPRIGDKIENMPGTFVFTASDSSADALEGIIYYSIKGRLGGHWTTKGYMLRGQQLSTNGVDWDRLHIYNGIVVEWPARFTPRDMSNTW